MSTLLEQVEAMLQGIIDARVREDWVELSTAINGLPCSTRDVALTRLRHLQADARNASALSVERTKAQRERDAALYDAKVWKQAIEDEKKAHEWTQVVLSTTRLAYDGVAKERDAARAEQAGVAAQRDAHLSRSVDLAARVTELEAALKRASCTLTATPAAVEVDGFRVGDLVRHRSSVLSWGVVDAVSQHVRVVCPGHDRGPDASSYRPDELARKPVEVGDTVRVSDGSYVGVRGLVDCIVDGEAYVTLGDGWGTRWLPARSLVAVAL